MRRCLDILLSMAALLVLSPLLLFLVALIRLQLGSPVLFKQMRPGYRERPFQLIKFRTMMDMRDSEGRPFPDSERLSSFGQFLRSTSMDELPELWNVLKGDMSLVGPRPLLTEYLDLYSCEQARRHEVPPGITGWAQVNGRNALSWNEKFALDVWYVDNRSVWLDFRIIVQTVWQVFSRKGVSHPGEATMHRFRGNE